MYYVDSKLYDERLSTLLGRPVKQYEIEKRGYTVLYDCEFSDKRRSEDDKFLTFVVMCRTVYTNLIVCSGNQSAILVSVNNIPKDATLDDLILLHGKEFIETFIQTQDIQTLISKTTIQPWGVVETNDRLYIPIEIIISDDMLSKKVFSVNTDKLFTHGSSEDCGLIPISQVKRNFILGNVSVIDKILIPNIKEVKHS